MWSISQPRPERKQIKVRKQVKDKGFDLGSFVTSKLGAVARNDLTGQEARDDMDGLHQAWLWLSRSTDMVLNAVDDICFCQRLIRSRLVRPVQATSLRETASFSSRPERVERKTRRDV
jgi:hypothetical protein